MVWTQTLMSVAEISNLFSVLSVLICFICMVIFILRVQGMQFPSSSVVYVDRASPTKVNCEKVEIPFICFLKSDNSSLKELEISVTTDVPCYFYALWCVPAVKLKTFLYVSWEDFVTNLVAENSLEAMKVEDRFLDPEEGTQTFNITLHTDICRSLLGQAPRTHFPLVTVLLRKERNSNRASNVGALVSVIHVADEDCPMPSTIIYQYLKQYCGPLFQLQNLYTQRLEPSTQCHNGQDETDSVASSFASSSPLLSDPPNIEVNEDGSCVICRVTKPTRALLPCRHVCVCSPCFSRVNNCPLCRSHISAFFITNPEEDELQMATEEETNRANRANPELSRHASFINNLNGILNSVLRLRDD